MPPIFNRTVITTPEGKVINNTDDVEEVNRVLEELHDNTESYRTELFNNIENHKNQTDNPHSVTKAQVGLANATNTSDANKPVSTDQEARILLAEKISNGRCTVRPVDPFRDYVEVRNADGVIRFPNMKFYMFGQVQVNVAAITVVGEYTELPFPTAFNVGSMYFVDLSAGTPAIATTNDIRLIPAENTVIIGWAEAGVFHTPHGFPVVYSDPSPERMAAFAGTGEMRIEAVTREVAGVPVPDERFGLFPFVTASTEWLQVNEIIQPNEVQARSNEAKIDLSYIPEGLWNDIVLKGTGQIYAGHGRTFFGTTDNLATFSGSPSFVRAKFTDMGGGANGVILETLAGSPVFSTIADPVHDLSIALSGQSQKVGGLRFGLAGGFCRGSRDPAWMESALDLDIRWINGATGGSAMDSRSVVSGTNYWWNNATDSDGPALTAWKAAVDAAMTEGQPVPELIDHAQGEGDAGAVQVGWITVDQLRATIQKVFASQRAYLISEHGATNPQILVMMPGSDESAIRRGMVGVHWAYLLAISNLSYVHQGIEMYDLPRPYRDIHLSPLGRYTVGYRNALAYANIMSGQSNDLGPELTGASIDSVRTAVLTFSAGAVMPLGDINDTTARGPYPFGLGIIPAGFTGSQQMLPLAGGRVVGSTIELYSHTALINSRVCRAGHDAGARMAQHVRNNAVHVKSVGMPLRTFVTAPLA